MSQSSLPRKTLIKMGISIAVVIILIALFSYWHLEAVLEKNERRLFTFSEKSAIVF